MEEGRWFFDASPYILIEATGDSDQIGYLDGALPEAAEHGVQSCGSRSSTPRDVRPAAARVLDGGEGNRPDFDCYFNGEQREGKEEATWRIGVCEEEEGVVDQYCSKRKTPPRPESNSVVAPGNNAKKQKKSSKANCEEMMNKGERDRLFWEACLAS